MSSTITFKSDHGDVVFDVDDSVAKEFAQSQNTASDDEASGVTIKGVQPMSEESGIEHKNDARFDKAMFSLKAYAGSLQDIVGDLDVRPREVSVEVGLKLKAQAGFFAIATAGTEADMKVKLTWEPKAKGDA